MQKKVISFIKDFLVYEELIIEDRNYLLVHGGLGDFSPDKDIEDFSLKELIWDRADYEVQYYEDRYVVTGHTPTQDIKSNPKPGFIFCKNQSYCSGLWMQ